MFTYKDSEAKMSIPKRNIKIENVSVEDGQLCDEEGNIAERIAKVLPDGVDEFTVKIAIVLPEEG